MNRPELVYANLELNDDNTDGMAVTLYFVAPASTDWIKEVCSSGFGGFNASALGVDVGDEYFEAVEKPTPVAELAGLVRYQVHPTC